MEIHWADIRTTDNCNDDSEDVRPARKLSTPGYLLYDGVDPADPGEEIIILAGTYDGEEKSWHTITCIPKRAYRGVVYVPPQEKSG